jgi:Bacterial Ig-like domain
MNASFKKSIFILKRNFAMKRFLLLSLPLFLFLLTACPSSTPGDTTKPTITSFSASPESLGAGGGSVTLNWEVTNADSLVIDNGVGTVTGTSTSVSVTRTTTFTLTATNASGSTTQSTSVSVGTGADTTPPSVIAVDPPDGATGVSSDAIITFTFSEPMDQAVTQAAYQSLDLPSSEVTFTWNDDSTLLEIVSDNFLEYATGDLAVAAKGYAFSVSETAQDISGNALEMFSSSFSTLRAIANQCPGMADLEGDVFSNATVVTDGSVIEVGDYADNLGAENLGVRGLFTFDLSTCLPPEGQLVSQGTLNVYKFVTEGNPDDLGILSLEHLTYGDSLTADDYNSAALTNLGVFAAASSPDGTWIEHDVSTAIQDDIANRATRGDRSQFRLSFAAQTDNNDDFDIIAFGATDNAGSSTVAPFIQVTYLIP